MGFEIALTSLLTVVVSIVITWQVWKLARLHGLIDVPNERSSHQVPTPRGGGVGIVLAASAAFVALMWLGKMRGDVFVALLGGGLAVAVVGFLDDRRRLPVSIRLVAHFGAAIFAVILLGGLPPVRIGETLVQLGWQGYLLASIGVVWSLNLFNFMDGIDGIAASESAFIAAGAVVLALAVAKPDATVAASMVFAAACCGFLVWNWPPAKIFMGDVGSGYVGYVIAVLSIASAHENPIAVFVWLILGAVFFVDSTVTLLRRFFRGERVYEAHRSHAYQILTRRWGSHRTVTLTVLFVNLALLFPMAWLATRYPSLAWLITILVLAGLSVMVLFVGAGHQASSAKKQA